MGHKHRIQGFSYGPMDQTPPESNGPTTRAHRKALRSMVTLPMGSLNLCMLGATSCPMLAFNYPNQDVYGFPMFLCRLGLYIHCIYVGTYKSMVSLSKKNSPEVMICCLSLCRGAVDANSTA